jgi:hypothetical protein
MIKKKLNLASQRNLESEEGNTRGGIINKLTQQNENFSVTPNTDRHVTESNYRQSVLDSKAALITDKDQVNSENVCIEMKSQVGGINNKFA